MAGSAMRYSASSITPTSATDPLLGCANLPTKGRTASARAGPSSGTRMLLYIGKAFLSVSKLASRKRFQHGLIELLFLELFLSLHDLF